MTQKISSKKNGKAIGSIVLGALSLLSAIFIWTGLLLSAISISFGIIGLVQGIKSRGIAVKGLSIAGIIINIIGLLIALLASIGFIMGIK